MTTDICGSKTHTLKTWPEYFGELWGGNKRFELQRDDGRNFRVGDKLELVEHHPERGASGLMIQARVSYILCGPEWGLPPDMVIMSLSDGYRFDGLDCVGPVP